MARTYERTHPWITFQLDLTSLDHEIWMLLGEALSKCEHIAGVPLAPSVAARLNEIYLSKGVHATTSIEGNTLSESEVLKRVQHRLDLPSSQEYLGQEIDNIVDGCNLVVRDVAEGRDLAITTQRVRQFNELVLRAIPFEVDAKPGQLRMASVLVGSVYRGAPAEDCPYLLDRLCAWLENLHHDAPRALRLPVAVLSAIIAHLYIAWIHPFADGNGRTARLIEFQLLIRAGVPTVAAHLLSDFYNRTRSQYYHVLAKTSRDPSYPIADFIRYALAGFVDELREQIGVIREQQILDMWTNFVHDRFRDRVTQAAARQRALVLALPFGRFTPMQELLELTTRLAREYAGKTPKTITRDVNAVERMGLVRVSPDGVRPLVETMHAFRPLRVDDSGNTHGNKEHEAKPVPQRET